MTIGIAFEHIMRNPLMIVIQWLNPLLPYFQPKGGGISITNR